MGGSLRAYTVILFSLPLSDSSGARSPCPRSAIVDGQGMPDKNQMLELMRLKGVPYVPDYMAPSEEEAERQFPNMIELTETYKARVFPDPT